MLVDTGGRTAASRLRCYWLKLAPVTSTELPGQFSGGLTGSVDRRAVATGAQLLGRFRVNSVSQNRRTEIWQLVPI